MEGLWYLTNDFLKLEPRNVLENILRDDKANYEKAESELGTDIQPLDNAIALYIELLQEAYRRVGEWKSKVYFKSSIAMANATLNYILLARHSILLGYFPEVRDLLRACHERMTRCYLFFADDNMARRFLSGGRVKQSTVDKKLADILGEASGDENEIHRSLRQSYEFASTHVHPNLESLELRTRGDVTNILFGGFLSPISGKAAITAVIRTMVFALYILGGIIKETTGQWDSAYERIKAEHDRMLSQIRDYLASSVETPT